jgi:oligopeptide/dipeptide ABC transporter ATP-binding protein
MDNSQLLVEVKDLKTYFYLEEGTVQAVDGADFNIYRGESLGVVGESGCGKSVTGQSIMRIVPNPGKIISGDIIFHRRRKQNGSFAMEEELNLAKLDARGPELRSIRGAEIAMVFQEPMTSLSPVHTIGEQIMEVIILHQDATKEEAREKAIQVLRRVGMPKPEQTVDNYPHQLSGGMRQRGMIAMGLSCNPSLLIADEPTTALDVTTQAQILELMRELQDELGMAIMFITHDLGVIAEMTKRVVVMYLGKVVEAADVDAIFYDPKHPYTRALLKSIPRIGFKSGEKLESIEGMVPDPYNIPKGCPFHPRCSSFMAGLCDQEYPKYHTVAPGHQVRCHLYNE